MNISLTNVFFHNVYEYPNIHNTSFFIDYSMKEIYLLFMQFTEFLQYKELEILFCSKMDKPIRSSRAGDVHESSTCEALVIFNRHTGTAREIYFI